MALLDAISDPVRLRLVRHLEAHGDASLQELADGAGVHLNTVRVHVSALEQAGVVARSAATPTHGPGRPPARFRLSDDWALPTSDFRGLAELLAAALVRSGAGREEMHAIGLEWGRWLLGRPGAHSVERDLPAALEQLGFSARLSGRTLELGSCPCTLVLPARPELVCELAAAVADGVLTGAGSPLRVGRRDHDPAARHCCAYLETTTA